MSKAEEIRLRRIADRRGLILRKSPRRNPRAVDFGLYALMDVETHGTLHPEGPISPYNLTADEVREALEAEVHPPSA